MIRPVRDPERYRVLTRKLRLFLRGHVSQAPRAEELFEVADFDGYTAMHQVLWIASAGRVSAADECARAANLLDRSLPDLLRFYDETRSTIEDVVRSTCSEEDGVSAMRRADLAAFGRALAVQRILANRKPISSCGAVPARGPS